MNTNADPAPLLSGQDLRVAYPVRGGGIAEVVRGVNFTLGRERLGIVGASGSGKSQTGRAFAGIPGLAAGCGLKGHRH